MAVADRVIVELEAKLDRYDRNVRAAEARFTSATRAIERDSRRMESQIRASSDQAGQSIRNLAGTFAAAFSAQQVVQLADSYTRFTNQLKLAGLEGAQVARVQGELFQIAQRNGVELETLGTLYGRLTQGAKELGATQADLSRFTSGVAAAIKVQGATTEASRGALIQLTQALGGQIVRAEEFNSVNEGARPILQAVANGITRFGGSVSKLRSEVIDGKVTSAEFFQGFLRGSQQLEAQATRSTLTIGQSFIALNNALGQYIGQTDQSLSATERISQAIITLSENLDTVANALGVIAAILVGRFVGGLVAGAAATGVVSTAIFAMQARAAGAATTMEALGLAGSRAGAALLRVFGGPVGLAITALTLGIGYLATQTDDAGEASEEYKQRQEQLTAVQGKARQAIERLTTATGAARAAALANAQAVRQETIQMVAQARAAVLLAQAKAAGARISALASQQQAEQQITSFGAGTEGSVTVDAAIRAGRTLSRANADVTAADRALAEANQTLAGLNTAIDPPTVNTNTGSGDRPRRSRTGRGGAGRDGPDPADVARRFLSDIERSQLDYEQATADVSGTLQARAQFERRRIEFDRRTAERDIRANEDFSAAQRDELLAKNQQVYSARLEALRAAELEQENADTLALAVARNEGEAELLRRQGQLVESTAERRAIDLRLLDLEYERERKTLENIRDNDRANEIDREIARVKLGQLAALQRADVAEVERRYEGPGQRYLRELNADDINEQLDQVRVRGLQTLNDQLTETIANIFKMGGAFGEVANQIIADLIRIAVQRLIIEPLAGAIFGGGTGGGFSGKGAVGAGASIVGALFGGGRASGGHVAAGTMYQVNERPGGVEGFMPAGSGKIIPLGQMNAAVTAGGGDGGAPIINMPISVVAPGANEQTVALIRQTIADAAPTLIQAAQRATMRQLTRPRMTR